MKLGFTGRSGVAAEAAANEAKLLAAVPMGRLCKAEDVAHAALWPVRTMPPLSRALRCRWTAASPRVDRQSLLK